MKNESHFSYAQGTQGLSDYLDEPEKFSRTRNLIEVQINSLYYFNEWGVDKTVLDGKIQVDAISSYIRQRAFTFGLILYPRGATQENFTSSINFYVED